MNLSFFIPEIKTVNGTKVPSTPFKCNKENPLFLGDVFECCSDDLSLDSKEVFIAELKDGQYIGNTASGNKETPLWILDSSMITVLGSSVSNPELLNLLTK